MNKIDLIDQDSGIKYSMLSIEAFCDAVLKELELDKWEFSLMFCTDDYIAELNSRYRGKDGPTDVLTFCENDVEDVWAVSPPWEGLYYAGDIVISTGTLNANSEYFEVAEDEELKRLIIHGILHLNGMDHDSNDADEEMLIFQEDILAKLGDCKF